MAHWIQKCLDFWFYLRRNIVSFLAYATLRLYGLELKYADVKQGTFSSRTPLPMCLDNVKDLDALLALSKEELVEAENRRCLVSDKCKTLLTLGSLLLGVVGLLLPKSLAFDSWWMRGPAIISVALLFNAIILLLVFYDVGSEMSVSVDQDDVELDALNLKKSLLNRRNQCRASTENRTDYLVDIYRAARFCFLSALTLIAALVLFSVSTNHPTEQTERMIREIRSDQHLINLLRGPKGEQGGVGNPGRDGSIGPKGDRGQDAKVDVDELVRRLLADPQLNEAISKAVRRSTTKSSSP